MPLPLSIRRRPRRLRAWLKDQQATLAAYERLTGKGLSPRQAASALGCSPAGIVSLRENLEELAGEAVRLQDRSQAERQELGLAPVPVPNARQPLRSHRHAERLSADDLAAERAGGICRAWRFVQRWRVPYCRRAEGLPAVAA